MTAENEFKTPPGRIVQGSLYEPQTTDIKGVRLKFKSGPKAGEDRDSYYFAIAISKGKEEHWSETTWGSIIWGYVHAHYANKVPRDFTWKVDDGDNEEPNSKEIRNCDREGFPGNWILRLANNNPPQIWNRELTAQIIEKNAINPGDWIEVFASMDINDEPGNKQSIFLNHRIIRFNSYGPRIQFARDPKSVGFDGEVMGSVTPLSADASESAPRATVNKTTPPPAKPGVKVEPHTKILDTAPKPPSKVAPKPPVRPVNKMTDAAEYTYEEYLASGWTDADLIEQGLMTP